MNDTIAIIGYGAVGRATAEALLARGAAIRVVQRRKPADLPAGATFATADALDPAALRAAVRGVGQIVAAFGIPYDTKLWERCWPLAMRNLIEAGEAEGARVVFVDDLYMFGPQDAPLREDTPLTRMGGKPGVRAAVTRIWSDAAARGRIRFAALRVSDFYGPGVGQSHLGTGAFGALAKGKAAWLIAPPDTPHDFAYVPDVARAVASLLAAGDDAYGQAWNMPCAPTTTPREILGIGAAAIGVRPRIHAVPLRALPLIGLASPFMREVGAMRFLFDRPYRVDARKFAARFWSDVTPFEVGAAATARSFVAAAQAGAARLPVTA